MLADPKNGMTVMNSTRRHITWASFFFLSIFAVACSQKQAKTAPKTEAPPKAVAEAKEKVAEEPKAEEEGGVWLTSPTYGVKFRVPDDWKSRSDENSVSANSPDGTTTVLLVGSESQNVIETALNDVQKKVQFKDVRINKTKMTVINGLAGYLGSGSAVLVKEDGDQEIQFSAYSLKVGKNAVSLMIFSEAEMYEAQKEMIDGIAQTITKTS
jgi:hypothetical protein